MTRESEYTGKSVETAIAEAEQALGKPRDELEIQVLSQGSRGVFGLGGEPARVLARDPAAPAVVPAPLPEPEEEPEPLLVAAAASDLQVSTDIEESAPVRPRGRSRSRDIDRESAREITGEAETQEVASSAKTILETLLDKMGFEVEVSVRPDEEPITLDVKGENLGILIGRRGDSLASLQFMVNVILSKQFHTWPRVVIDIQGYRARREESLSSLGQRVADRVRRNRRPFTLEAMPANDRRIIHLTLRERNDVETYSIGEGQSRRVVIAPKK